MEAGNSANMVVIVLMVIILVVPVALLLLDHLRRRDSPTAGGAGEGGLSMRPVGNPQPTIAMTGSGRIATNFGTERLPDRIGYVHATVEQDGDLAHRGYLQIGAGVTVRGNVHVDGSLALASGATVLGDVNVRGNVHVGVSSRVRGGIAADGDVIMDRWSEVREIVRATRVFMTDGARVHGRARAAALIHAREVGTGQPLDGA